MLVATWNVNSVKARLPRLLEFLDARGPDVVCLQELKVSEDAFPMLDVRAAGYEAVVVGQRQWNGVAVLAREPLALRHAGLPGEGGSGARLVAAAVDGLDVVSVYVPNGKDLGHDDFAGKLRWLERLGDFLAQAYDPGAPLVVAGDFNVCPADVDSFDPVGLAGGIFHTDAERAALSRLRDWGLVDLFRRAHPDVPGFSWWDYRGGNFHRGLGLRIDLLLGTAPVAAGLQGAAVERDFRKGPKPSDHAPVTVDVAL